MGWGMSDILRSLSEDAKALAESGVVSHEMSDDLEKSSIESEAALAAMEEFFGISRDLGLSIEQERSLLGVPSNHTVRLWKAGEGPALPESSLHRIRQIIIIHRILPKIFPFAE